MDGKHLPGFFGEIARTFHLGTADNRIAVSWRRLGLEMRFKEILINAKFGTAQTESCFEALCRAVEGALVQALVFDAFHLNNRAHSATLGDKAPIINEAEYAALLGQGAGFAVILYKFANV